MPTTKNIERQMVGDPISDDPISGANYRVRIALM